MITERWPNCFSKAQSERLVKIRRIPRRPQHVQGKFRCSGGHNAEVRDEWRRVPEITRLVTLLLRLHAVYVRHQQVTSLAVQHAPACSADGRLADRLSAHVVLLWLLSGLRVHSRADAGVWCNPAALPKTTLLGTLAMLPVIANILLINIFIMVNDYGPYLISGLICASLLIILWHQRAALVSLLWSTQNGEAVSSLRIHRWIRLFIVWAAITIMVSGAIFQHHIQRLREQNPHRPTVDSRK